MSVRHWFRWLKKSDPKDKEKRGQHDDKGVNGIWRTKSLRPSDTAGLSPSAEQSSKVTITDAHLSHIPEVSCVHIASSFISSAPTPF
jgi:hypothetical protein